VKNASLPRWHSYDPGKSLQTLLFPIRSRQSPIERPLVYGSTLPLIAKLGTSVLVIVTAAGVSSNGVNTSVK
jgi:hypothetical protein